MINRNFFAFALLHTLVPAICVAFYGARPLWLIGSVVFSAAAIRSIHAKSTAPAIIYRSVTPCGTNSRRIEKAAE